MNQFEELLAGDKTPPLGLPPTAEYEPLTSSPFDMEAMPRNKSTRLNSEAAYRLVNLWTDEDFLSYPNNHDPVYLTKDRNQVDVITLIHRLKPHTAPYEKHQWIRYISGGGLHHDSDNEYFVSPLTAFFFSRWLLEGEATLMPNSLRAFLSPHAAEVIRLDMLKFKEADPLEYVHKVESIAAELTSTRLKLRIGNYNHIIPIVKVSRDPTKLTPAMLRDLLVKSFKEPCDSDGKIMMKDGQHPPFYKPHFTLPLWQSVYHEIGERLTKQLMQEDNLVIGCVLCPSNIRSVCGFTFANYEEN